MDGEDLSDTSDEENWMDTAWSNEEVSNRSTKLPTTCTNTQHIQDLFQHTEDDKNTTRSEKTTDDSLMSRMRLNDNKAGMEGLDKEKINQIILEASKGSKFYENERKKEEQVRKRILEQQEKYEKITEAQLSQGLIQADMLLEEFECGRDLSHTIVHIDMDAFYAAVEIRDKPSLRDKPMAVGGNSMLSTSNYHARKYGVRAAMPGFIGKKLCPDLTIVPLNFEKYTTVSKQVKKILAEYDPNFCPMSLDEAYLDITDHLHKRQTMTEEDRTYLCRKCDNLDSYHCLCDLNEIIKERLFENKSLNSLKEWKEERLYRNASNQENGVKSLKSLENGNICPVCGKPFPDYDAVVFGTSPDDTVQEMRSRIEQKTRLTASAGIAPNMMLSKVCSDKNKPNGQYRIQPTVKCVMDFIKDLPIRKISGIGKVSEQMLNAVGVETCTDLYNKRALLYHLYSQISFNYFMRICLGIGSTTVERDSERKSISTERTFNEISKPAELYSKCKELCQALSVDLEEEQLKGKTVTIKLKTVKFEVKTRAHTLPEYTSDGEIIFSAAKDLLKTEIQNVAPNPLRLRLMGVRMSSLLHQSLCKSKQKQRTLSGLVKKMINNSTSNVANGRLAQDTQTTDQITNNKNTQNDLITNKDDVEDNTCNSVILYASLVTNKSESDLEKMLCTSTSTMTKPLKDKDRSCDNDIEDDIASQNPLMMRAKCNGTSIETSKMEEFSNTDTVTLGFCSAKEGNNIWHYPETPCDVKSVNFSSAGLILSKNNGAEDSEKEMDYVDSFAKCDKELFECNRNPNEKPCGVDNINIHVKCEIDLQESDYINQVIMPNSLNDGSLKLTAMETGNDFDFTSKNGSAENTTILSLETEQGSSGKRSCVSENSCYADEKTSVSLDTKQESTRENFSKSEGFIHPGDESPLEHRTDTLDTGIENIYECPVCRNDVKFDTLSDLNQHIDICLNKKVVMDCSRDENLQADLKQNVKSLVHKKSPSVSKKTKVKYNTMRSPKLAVSKYAEKHLTPSKFVKSPKSIPSKSSNNNLVSPASVEEMSQNNQFDSQNRGLFPNFDLDFNKNKMPVCVDVNFNSGDAALTANETPQTPASGHRSNTGQEMTITKLICPVCFMEQTGTSLDEFNSHMDTCLSKGAISDILKEQKIDEDKVQRSYTEAQKKLKGGKRKRANSGQISSNCGQNKIRSIDLFFKA